MVEPGISRPYWETRRQVLAAIRAEAAGDADPERAYLDLLEGLVVDAALERDAELADARQAAAERDVQLAEAKRRAAEREAALARAQRATQERDEDLSRERQAAAERDQELSRARSVPADIHAWLNDLAVAHPDHAALISELAELFERRWLGPRASSARVPETS